MANTDFYLTLPSPNSSIRMGGVVGAIVTASSSAWAYGSWVLLAGSLSRNINIVGFTFQPTNIPSTDSTVEQLWEIGIGGTGVETAIIQIPTSFRSDTAVAIYLDKIVFYLPEPKSVAMGSRVSVRVTNSVASAYIYNGVKLLYQNSVGPIESEVALPNNYQHPRSESAGVISLGEKTR